MDVQCERCKTEYDFDDALVSGRGTTVRCTTCGHQFKVRRPEGSVAAGPAEEVWVVTTTHGESREYKSLRELQKAILAKSVNRSDTLRHGDAPPRLLGSIAELEPFFEGRGSSRPASTPVAAEPKFPAPPGLPAEFPKRTPAWGVAAASSEPPSPKPSSVTPPMVSTLAGPPRASARPPVVVPPVRGKTDTLRPPAQAAAVPPPPAQVAPPPPMRAPYPTEPGVAPPSVEVAPTPLPSVAYERGYEAGVTPNLDYAQTSHAYAAAPSPPAAPAPAPPPSAGVAFAEPPPIETSSPLPPPTIPRRRVVSTYDEDRLDAAMRGELDSYSGAPRRRTGGWILAFVLLAGAGAVGFFVAKPYLGKMQSAASASTPPIDERTQQYLADGDKALADGNLELAKESYDKASARSEKDPRVLVAVARLAAARADVPWLRMRVLPPDAADDVKGTKQALADLSASARKAADDALAIAPDDAAAVRAKIDAARIAGDRDAARKLVAKIVNNKTEPETAYVLAALDLAEPEPVWPTVIDRLKLAAAGEGNLGRARSALVYALARSGDKPAALAELEKLDKLTRPHPNIAALRAFVDKTKGKGPNADGGAPSAPIAAIDVTQLPQGKAQTPANDPLALEGKSPQSEALRAMRKHDYARARSIYEALVARNGNDSEALCGLADVARATGSSGDAIAKYKQVLAINPSYLPAIIGLADTYWASGNRGEAVRLYKELIDRFPESAYPAYVKQRAGEAPPPPAPAPAASDSSSPAPAPAPAPASAPVPSPAPAPTSTPAPKPSTTDGF